MSNWSYSPSRTEVDWRLDHINNISLRIALFWGYFQSFPIELYYPTSFNNYGSRSCFHGFRGFCLIVWIANAAFLNSPIILTSAVLLLNMETLFISVLWEATSNDAVLPYRSSDILRLRGAVTRWVSLKKRTKKSQGWRAAIHVVSRGRRLLLTFYIGKTPRAAEHARALSFQIGLKIVLSLPYALVHISPVAEMYHALKGFIMSTATGQRRKARWTTRWMDMIRLPRNSFLVRIGKEVNGNDMIPSNILS